SIHWGSASPRLSTSQGNSGNTYQHGRHAQVVNYHLYHTHSGTLGHRCCHHNQTLGFPMQPDPAQAGFYYCSLLFCNLIHNLLTRTFRLGSEHLFSLSIRGECFPCYAVLSRQLASCWPVWGIRFQLIRGPSHRTWASRSIGARLIPLTA